MDNLLSIFHVVIFIVLQSVTCHLYFLHCFTQHVYNLITKHIDWPLVHMSCHIQGLQYFSTVAYWHFEWDAFLLFKKINLSHTQALNPKASSLVTLTSKTVSIHFQTPTEGKGYQVKCLKWQEKEKTLKSSWVTK